MTASALSRCKPVPLFRAPSSLPPLLVLSCLQHQNGCVSRAERKMECVGDRDAGESERKRWWGQGGGAEQRQAVVMSHLLQAGRMAAECWHVPHRQDEGAYGEKN